MLLPRFCVCSIASFLFICFAFPTHPAQRSGRGRAGACCCTPLVAGLGRRAPERAPIREKLTSEYKRMIFGQHWHQLSRIMSVYALLEVLAATAAQAFRSDARQKMGTLHRNHMAPQKNVFQAFDSGGTADCTEKGACLASASLPGARNFSRRRA